MCRPRRPHHPAHSRPPPLRRSAPPRSLLSLSHRQAEVLLKQFAVLGDLAKVALVYSLRGRHVYLLVRAHEDERRARRSGTICPCQQLDSRTTRGRPSIAKKSPTTLCGLPSCDRKLCAVSVEVCVGAFFLAMLRIRLVTTPKVTPEDARKVLEKAGKSPRKGPVFRDFSATDDGIRPQELESRTRA